MNQYHGTLIAKKMTPPSGDASRHAPRRQSGTARAVTATIANGKSNPWSPLVKTASPASSQKPTIHRRTRVSSIIPRNPQ